MSDIGESLDLPEAQGEGEGREVEPLERPAERVLLVGWDAADWKIIEPLMAAGRMPNFQRFCAEGVRGNIASLTPMLSPILWTSIATGKHADKHQILGFAEPEGTTGRVRPVTSTSRRCKALWNILSRRGLRCGVVNWFASHPAERIKGFVVTDRFGRPTGPVTEPWRSVPGSIHPEELREEIEALRVHPGQITREQVRHFVARVDELNPRSEPMLAKLMTMLARCASVHAATTLLAARDDWDFLGVYLEEIDRFGHEFMEYRPPRMEHVDEREFELFKDVMDGVYTFHDMMLGRLIELVGDETTVIIVSDHGFHSDEMRPEGSSKIEHGRPVAWHRAYGVVAMRGPHIKRNERVYGASLLDVAPTVLAMLGQPVPGDMDGRPLMQVYDRPVRVEKIETYEVEGEEHDAPEIADDPWLAREMMVQLADLGYVEDDSMENIVRDRRRNLGQVYLATARPALALEQFELLLEDDPEEKGAKMAAANCLLSLGRLDECEAIVDEVLSGAESAPVAAQYRGMICFRRGEDERALEYLRQAEAQGERNAPLYSQIGSVYLRRAKWEDAERSFVRALEIDPEHAAALDGLGVAQRQLGKVQEAVLSHMKSIALLNYQAQTHFHLGLALAELGRARWAAQAFRTSLEINPNNPAAHRCLAQLCERVLNRPRLAEMHRAKAAELEGAGCSDAEPPA